MSAHWIEGALSSRLDLGLSVARELLSHVIALDERWRAADVPYWSELFRPRMAGATYYNNDMLTPAQFADVLQCRRKQPQWSPGGARARSAKGFGRVLLMHLNVVDYNGIARVASGGYFDSSGIPPWETWLSIGVYDNGEQDPDIVLGALIEKWYVPFVDTVTRAYPWPNFYAWADELEQNTDFSPLEDIRGGMTPREFEALLLAWKELV